MLDYQKLKQKKFYIFGLGKSGIATAQFLKNIGAEVQVWDDQKQKLHKMQKLGFKIINPEKWIPQKDYTLILAPGIPLTYPKTHPLVKKAKEKNLNIIGDIELFITHIKENYFCKIIAITGTNGKSTTTALLNHCLKKANKKSVMLGNIGKPIFEMQNEYKDDNQPKFFVIEISSYQIDLLDKAKFDAAILLNISPDHIDRHGSLNNYKNVKAKLIQNHLKKNALALIGMDDPYSRQIYNQVSKNNKNTITISQENLSKDIVFNEKTNQALKGKHNKQNALAVSIMCQYLGIETEKINAGLKTFVSLPHRMEIVAEQDNFIFVNDSKATNAQAAQGAILSYRNIYWIIGGKAKKQGIQPLLPYLDNIKKAYLIGEAAQQFAQVLDGKIEFYIAGELNKALEKAYSEALEDRQRLNGENVIILFSPACSSFDQFDNFEKRGDMFRNWVFNKINQNKQI